MNEKEDVKMTEIALVYFSETGTTTSAAKKIAKILNVPAIRLEAQVPYTSADLNWNDDSSRANKEQGNPSARPKFKPLKIDNYDTLILGYPTWWGVPPRIIDSFVESLNLKGKTDLPFPSDSSTPERGVAELGKLLPGTLVLDGKRVNNSSEAELEKWLRSNNIA